MVCTSICFVDNGHSVYATNYDHEIFEGYLIVNKKNISKKSHIPNAKGEFCSWISKYGSVTFNLGAPQFAWGGINEAGLVSKSTLPCKASTGSYLLRILSRKCFIEI